MELFYSEIKVGDRYRQDVGDLEPLKASIQKLGQLHPVVISEDHQLISGYRRLQACKELNRAIEIRVLNIDDWLQAEHDENEVRKNFTVSERVAITEAIQKRIGDRRGVNQYTKEDQVDRPEAKPGEQTRDYAARKAGFNSEPTARRARNIVKNGSSELVEAVDKGEISIFDGHAIAELPKEEQAAVIKEGKKAVSKKAREVEQSKSRTKGKKQAKGETFRERQMRSLELTTGRPVGISREEFDPDFKGTSMEFVDKYGHVQIFTKKELEEGNDRAAFSAWVAAIRSLKVPLGKYLKGEKFKPENFHAWIKRAKSPEARMAEVKELVSLIVQTHENIEWLLPLLETQRTNGDHP